MAIRIPRSHTTPLPTVSPTRGWAGWLLLALPHDDAILSHPSGAGVHMANLDAKVRHLSDRIDQLRPAPPGPRRQRALAAAAASAPLSARR